VAQEKSTLEITGRARIMVRPDLAVFNAEINAIDMEYGRVIAALNKKTASIEKQLVSLDFSPEDIKTVNFSVRKNYEYKKGERIDSGFIASHVIRVEFPYDKDRLGALISALVSSTSDANIQFEFDLSASKRNEIETTLIQMGLDDASGKAKVIVGSTGLNLGKIILIRYNGESPQAPVYRMQASARMESDTGAPDLEAREIEMSREIFVIWALE